MRLDRVVFFQDTRVLLEWAADRVGTEADARAAARVIGGQNGSQNRKRREDRCPRRGIPDSEFDDINMQGSRFHDLDLTEALFDDVDMSRAFLSQRTSGPKWKYRRHLVVLQLGRSSRLCQLADYILRQLGTLCAAGLYHGRPLFLWIFRCSCCIDFPL